MIKKFALATIIGFIFTAFAGISNAYGQAGGSVNGGGWIRVGEGRADFGFSVRSSAGVQAPSGHLTYIDHANSIKVKATSIDSLTIIGNQASIQGSATVNDGREVTYYVVVADNGEPGRGADTFSINLSNGYSASGALVGGNIQLHNGSRQAPPRDVKKPVVSKGKFATSWVQIKSKY